MHHHGAFRQVGSQADTRGLKVSSGRWTLDGKLTVRGVIRPVTLTLHSIESSTTTGFQAHGTARVDRYAFGVTAAKGMAYRWLDVKLTAVAERA